MRVMAGLRWLARAVLKLPEPVMSQSKRMKNWSAEVTAHGCARSRAARLQQGRSFRNRRIAQTVRGVERSPQIGPLPVSDVDADLVHQSRGPKSAARSKADARSSEDEIAGTVLRQRLRIRSHRGQRQYRWSSAGAALWAIVVCDIVPSLEPKGAAGFCALG